MFGGPKKTLLVIVLTLPYLSGVDSLPPSWFLFLVGTGVERTFARSVEICG